MKNWLDLREQLPRGRGRWAVRDESAIRYLVIHHSGADYDTIKTIADYHTSFANHITPGTSLPSIAYHIGIEGGKIHLLNPFNFVTQHAAGFNNKSIGVLVVGNFSKREPDEETKSAIQEVCEYLTENYMILPSRVIGHCETRSGGTVCPGKILDFVKRWRSKKMTALAKLSRL